MADTKTSSPVPAAISPVKPDVTKKVTPKTSQAKAPQMKPAHPSTAEMVNSAIKTLAEKSGSSLQAIKKYMASTYKLDITKHANFIKKYLKSAVASGVLIQTRGIGAAGSFKLAAKKEATKPKPKAAVAKKPAPKKVSTKKSTAKKAEAGKAGIKKPAAPKKSAAAKKPTTEKKAKPAVAAKVVKLKTPKSPKAKKATKGPTAKPKAPKPKKVAATKATKTAAKKATSSKK